MILVGISFQLKLPLPKESNQEKLLGQLRKDREGPSQDGGGEDDLRLLFNSAREKFELS